jgi:GlpG protein
MKNKLRISYNAPVTLSFVLVCFIVTIIGVVTNNGSTMYLFSAYKGSLSDPLTYVRLFTHVLGHSGFDHLMSNAMYILVLGPMLEEKYGSKTVAKVFAGTAFITGILHCLLWGNYALCGASGIVFACILLSSFTAFHNGDIPASFILVAVLYIGKEVVQGLMVTDNISNFSHILGGIIGSLEGYLLNRKHQ